MGGPNPDAESMNYTCVINSAVWGGALLYYAIDARKWFRGPQITIDLDQLTEAQEQALREEGVKIESEGGKAVVGGRRGSTGSSVPIESDLRGKGEEETDK